MDGSTNGTDGSESPAADGGLPPLAVRDRDPVYEALAHPRRRCLCYALRADAERSLTELATKIAAWERGVTEDAIAERDRERLLVSLYHTHVPKLVDHNVVAFDEATETIRAAENADRVLEALEAVAESLDGRRDPRGGETGDGWF